jgi:hypothetical protein
MGEAAEGHAAAEPEIVTCPDLLPAASNASTANV